MANSSYQPLRNVVCVEQVVEECELTPRNRNKVAPPHSFLSATRLSSMFFRNVGVGPCGEELGEEEEKGRSRWSPVTPTAADSLTIHSPADSLIPSTTSERYSIHGGEDESHAGMTDDGEWHAPVWLRVLYFVPLMAFLIYLVIDSFTARHFLRWTKEMFEWVGDHVYLGPLVYFGAVIVFAHLCIPESFLTIGGGYIFSHAHGPPLGILISFSSTFCGLFVGSLSTFLIARYLIQDKIQRCAHRYTVLRAIDHLLEDQGTKMVLLLRLSPIVPFNVLNYVMGVTMVSVFDFLRGNVGMIPWVTVCCTMGAGLSGLSDVFTAHHSKSYRAVLYVSYTMGIVITAVVVYLIVKYTRTVTAPLLRVAQQQSRAQLQTIDSSGDTPRPMRRPRSDATGEPEGALRPCFPPVLHPPQQGHQQSPPTPSL